MRDDVRLARAITGPNDRPLYMIDAVASGTNEVDGQVLPAVIPVTTGQRCQLIKQGDAPALILGPIGGGPRGMFVGSDDGSVSGVSTSLTDVGASVTWTADPAYVYVVTAYARAIPSATGNRCVVMMTNAADSEVVRLIDQGLPSATGGAGSLVGHAQDVISGASGSVTRKLRTAMAAGTSGTVTVTGTVTVLAFPA